MPGRVSIRLEKVGSLVIHRTQIRVSVQVKGIVAGEADFNQASSALHGVNAGADKVAVIEDVAGSRHQIHVGERGLQNLCAAANGREFQLSGAQCANKRAARGFHNDVARNFLQVNVAGHALEFHIPGNLLNINQTCLRLKLKFRLFGNGQLKVGFQFLRLSRRAQGARTDVNAVAYLFDIHGDFVSDRSTGNNHFRVLRRFHLDAPVHDVLQHDDWVTFNGEMAFLVFRRTGNSGGRGEENESGAPDTQGMARMN